MTQPDGAPASLKLEAKKSEERLPLSALTVIASAKATEQVVAALFEAAKGTVRDHLKRWRTTHKMNTLYRKLSGVRKVKTIWQFEKEVDLFTVYYPSRIVMERTERQSKASLTSLGMVTSSLKGQLDRASRFFYGTFVLKNCTTGGLSQFLRNSDV